MEEMFFELLGIAIGSSRNLSAIPMDGEWLSLYEKASKQSLVGILFYGIQKSGMRLDRGLLLKWFLASEQIKQYNQKTNKVAVELVQFFRDNGFRTCILKGQGNTLNYPEPYVRTSGDIDVWVEGGCEKILNWVRGDVGNLKFCYHHIEFKKISGVEVEVHYRPSFMNNLIHNKRMQRWFERVADEQFRHEVEFPDGVGKVCVPTNAFNRIYQMSHISNHFFHEGIGFRQMLDYYFVLRQGFTEEERVRDTRLLKHFGLYKMASAVMYVLRETLGMESKLMIVPVNENLGRFLMDEMLQAGNFGQYDSRTGHGQGKWARNVQRLKRDVRLVRYFPSECLWEPVFRIWHWGWRKRFSRLASKKK